MKEKKYLVILRGHDEVKIEELIRTLVNHFQQYQVEVEEIK
jgi:hypothetical protein